MLGIIADVLGIASFGLSLLLLVLNEALRKEIEGQRSDYKREQRVIRETLVSLRDSIIEDKVFNQKIVSDIRTNLYSYNQKFRRLLSLGDKQHLKKTLHILGAAPEEIDQSNLCTELDYFVARFQRKERK